MRLTRRFLTMASINANGNNIKSVLHSWCSMSRFPAPIYQISEVTPSKTPLFQAQVSLEFLNRRFNGEGRGTSKAGAKTSAAENICQKLNEAGYDVLSLPRKLKIKPPPIKFEITRQSKLAPEKPKDPEETPNNDRKRKLDQEDEKREPPHKRTRFEVPPPSIIACKIDCGKSLQSFSWCAWQHYFKKKQKKIEFDLKLKFMSKLTDQVRRYIDSEASVYIFGSSISGLGSRESDLDMCLSLPVPQHIRAIYEYYGSDSSPDILYDQNIRDFNIRILRHLRKLMHRFFHKNRKSGMDCSNILVIPAKVPILKLENVKFGSLALEVDININNTQGMRNSHLLHYYNMIDARFGAMVLIVKTWASKAQIASPKDGTLSGLALSLMVLHVLQQPFDNQPPIMPDLQELLPHIFNREIPVANLRVFAENILPNFLLNENFNMKNESNLPNLIKNDHSLAKLLLRFFEYYATHVDFQRHYISIRSHGRLLDRSLLPHGLLVNDQYIFVQEPFDGSNTARCVYQEYDYLRIKKAFQEACLALNENLCLHSLGIDFMGVENILLSSD